MPTIVNRQRTGTFRRAGELYIKDSMLKNPPQARGRKRDLFISSRKVVEMGGVEPPSRMFNRLALQA